MAVWSWQKVSQGSPPSDRYYAKMAYDRKRGVAVMYGGYHYEGGPTTILSDTWELASPGVWSEKTPANSPGARYQHATCWDPISETVLLFGGADSGGTRKNDLWSFDGTDWTELIADGAGGSPSGRQALDMVVDLNRRRLVLFGGYDGSSDDETWELNLDSLVWSQPTPATTPAARVYHSLSYDETDKVVRMFQGSSSISGLNTLGDTWEYDGDDWTQVDTNFYPSVKWHGCPMVWHAKAEKMLVLGTTGLSEEMVHSWVDEDWSEVTVLGGDDLAGHKHTAGAYADSDGAVYIFTPGYDTADSETWRLAYFDSSSTVEEGPYTLITDAKNYEANDQGHLKRDKTIVSRCRARVLCKRGQWALDPEFGSRLWTIKTLKRAEQLALIYIEEALADLVAAGEIVGIEPLRFTTDYRTGCLAVVVEVALPQDQVVPLGMFPLGE